MRCAKRLTGAVCLIFSGMILLVNHSTCVHSTYNPTDTLAVSIDSVLRGLRLQADEYYADRAKKKTAALYLSNGHANVWLTGSHPTSLLHAFLDEVARCGEYAMNPDEYQIDQLRTRVIELYDQKGQSSGDVSALEIRITTSFFLFTTHLLEGRIRQAGSPGFIWRKGEILENDVQILQTVKSPGELRKNLEALHPTERQYRKLAHALDEYREMSKDPDVRISFERPLAPGDRHTIIPQVRKRLSKTDLSNARNPGDSLLFDDTLVEAVRRFQHRHGLKTDGLIDKSTVERLNIPLRQKAEIIAVNLERMRWRPHLQFGVRDLLVNIPAYTLTVTEDGEEITTMRVVLGSGFDPTPVFHDTLKYIVLNPTWTVPKSIIRDDFIPVLVKDPSHFDGQGFTFYRDGEEIDPESEKWNEAKLQKYRIVQAPGGTNSLGRVKFVLPSYYSIYRHDTPSQRLFAEQTRALSHGCIRLERPLELAKILLEEESNWNREQIDQVVASGQTTSVELSKGVPVHIVYRTAWVDEDGRVQFRDDVYGHDKRHISRLNKTRGFVAFSINPHTPLHQP